GVVESYEYDPYGKPTIKDGGGSTITASAIGNSRMFTARQFDEETGLYHYRARAYSPELRRFVQRDPLEYVDGPCALTYCSTRPAARFDPSGLAPEGYPDSVNGVEIDWEDPQVYSGSSAWGARAAVLAAGGLDGDPTCIALGDSRGTATVESRVLFEHAYPDPVLQRRSARNEPWETFASTWGAHVHVEVTSTYTRIRIRRVELRVTGGTPGEVEAAARWNHGVLAHEYIHALDRAWNKKCITVVGCGVSSGNVDAKHAMQDAREKAGTAAADKWTRMVKDTGDLLLLNSVMTLNPDATTDVHFAAGVHSK
ncbi:MAG: RHS repeat-associated core domain-containing protein, partial [Phycisphaerales bacterium]|nr:RHS repeat-associated core domain-containing protein [Phycisphaerales bacterium]